MAVDGSAPRARDALMSALTSGPTGFAVEDDHARSRAVDPSGSFIVQAPAGSGKTGLLVLRLLGLLGRVARPECILAITFTRRAQAEMRHRVIEALTEAAAGRPLPAQAQPFEHERRGRALAALARSRALGWDLLSQPERIGILTIDALNARLVNRLPITSGLGMTPQPCEDATHLFAEAIHSVLQCLEEGPEVVARAVERVLVHLDNDRQLLERLLQRMLAGRDSWQRHLDVLHDTESLQAALATEVGLRLRALRARLPEGFLTGAVHWGRWALEHLEADSQTALALAPLRLEPAEPEAAGRPAALPGDALADVPAWRAIAMLLLTRDGTARKTLDKRIGFPIDGIGAEKAARKAAKAAALDFIRRVFAEDPELPGLLHTVRKLPAEGYGPEQAESLLALGTLLQASLHALAVASAARGELDFPALAAGALAALGPEDAPTDLSLALDARIEHILLDEFQDTSPSQVALLTRLVAGWQAGDGRTLFLVGDPMQSIYGFRDADVNLFLKIWQQGQLGPVPLEQLVLRRNFRSRAGIVDWVNDCFRALMPAVPDQVRGRIAYAASLPAATDREEPARVEVHALEDRTTEAARVVALVQGVRARHPEASIALLASARSHLQPALSALARAGLPVQGVGLETLGGRTVVRDLMSLARALAHPGDRLAWLACLRAPWCGLDLASLTHLGTPVQGELLWHRLADPGVRAGLSTAMRARLEACLPAFAVALATRSTTPLARRVERCWTALGGPLCLADETDRRAAWQCLRLLCEHGDADMQRLETALEGANIEPPAGASAGLQALTMHKAKGLEFDVVLLIGLGSVGRRAERPLLEVRPRTRAQGQDSLLVAPIAARSGRSGEAIADFLHAIALEDEHEERLRLLYVATTRARRELHLLACARFREAKGEEAGWTPAQGSLLAHLWPALLTHWQALPPPKGMAAHATGVAPRGPAPARDGVAPMAMGACTPSPPPADPAAPASRSEPLDRAIAAVAMSIEPATMLQRLPLGWRWPELPPDLPAPGATPSPPSDAPAAPAPTPVYEWAGRAARAVGSTVHAILQVIAEDGLDAWDAARVAATRPHLRARLAAAGLTGAELDHATGRVAQAIERTLDDPRGRWCLGSHRQARSEWALCAVLEGEVVQRVIDRWLVTDDGIWIVDFKTSSHEGGGLDTFLDNEVERYRPQLDAYARLVASLDPRPVHLGLYFPLLGGWRSWRADDPGA